MKQIKAWYAITHTRIGSEWCFAWAAWSSKPSARTWTPAAAVGAVNQLDGESVVMDARDRALEAITRTLPEGARLEQLEGGFALAAHREHRGEPPAYKPIPAPGMAAEAYYAVIEVDRGMALPKQAIEVVRTPPTAAERAIAASMGPLAVRSAPGMRTFWAVWVTCGKPTLEPWTPPDDLGAIEGHGAFEQAIGTADEACRRIRGARVHAYSVGQAFAARAYRDGVRCTRSGLADIAQLGAEALSWLDLSDLATESEVRRAFGAKVRDEKIHPDQGGTIEGFQAAEAKKRAAIDFLAYRARSTGKITAFTQEKIDKAEAKKKRAAEKAAKKAAGVGA